MGFIKIKKIHASKDTTKQMKKKRDWEKMSAIPVFLKQVALKICNVLVQYNNYNVSDQT